MNPQQPLNPHQQASLAAVNSGPPVGASGGGAEPAWWQKLLPTAGSVLGGIGGALIPGLGETGLSEVAGSAAGGAAGKGLENFLTGQSGGELGAAAEGGIGAGVGGLLGKAAGGLGKGALDLVASKTMPKVAEDVAATAAPVEGTAQAVYDKPFVDALGDASAANRMRKQGIDFQPTRDFMQNQMGASNDPAEWSKIANFIAGNPGTKDAPTQGAWLSKQVTNAAANQPNLPKGEVLNQLHGIAQSHGSSLLEPEATDTMGKFLAKGLADATGKDLVSGADTYSAEGLQQLVKSIGNRWAKNPLTMDAQAQTTNAKVVEHEALPEVKQFLSDLVNNRGGVNEAIARDTTSGDQAAKIMAEAPTPQAGKYVIDSMNNGQTAAEINAAARPAVHADKIAQEVMDYQRGIKPVVQQGKDVATAQAAADKEAAAASKAAADEAAKPHPAESATANVVNALAGSPMDKVRAAAKGAGGFVPALNALATKGSAALAKTNPGRAGAITGGALGSLGNLGNPNQQGGGGMPPGMTSAGMNIPGAAGQPGGGQMGPGGAPTGADILSKFAAMAEADPFQAGAYTPTAQALSPQVTAAHAAQQALGQYQNTLQAAGGPQGPIGGLLAQLGGLLTGGPASQVGPQQQALLALLARAGLPGMQVPGLMANQAGAQAGMAPVQSALGAISGQ